MKKFLIGMIAVLSVSLFLIGCSTEAEEKIVTNTTVLSVKTWVTDEGELIAALDDLDSGVIGLKDSTAVTLSETVTVPSGRTVVLYAELETDTGELIINGGVIVGNGGTLIVTDADHPVVLKGALEVQSGGKLTLTEGTALSVSNGAETAATALGSVTYSGGSLVFTVAGDLSDATKIGAAVGSINGNGTLEIGAPVALTPSVLAGIDNIGPSKGLKVASSVNEDLVGTLIIPAGADITAKSDDAFATITGITVNGTLTAAGATLAAVTTVSGTGSLTAGVVTAGKAETVIESTLKSVSLASTTITADEGLAIPANTTRIFTGATAPSGNVTVNGRAVASSSLTIVAGKELAIADTGVVSLIGTGSVVLNTGGTVGSGGAKITGTGKLTAQDTEIVGGTTGWLAVLASGSTDTTVTIASTATAGQSSITGTATSSLKGAAGATITQKAGTTANKLTLAANTTVNLSGTDTVAGAVITLDAGAEPAQLALAAATSKILLGAGSGGSDIGGLTITIATKTVASGGSFAVGDFKVASGKLVQIGGTNAGTLTATTTAADDVPIASNSAVTGT